VFFDILRYTFLLSKLVATDVRRYQLSKN